MNPTGLYRGTRQTWSDEVNCLPVKTRWDRRPAVYAGAVSPQDSEDVLRELLPGAIL